MKYSSIIAQQQIYQYCCSRVDVLFDAAVIKEEIKRIDVHSVDIAY
jgi:hypothetical protein